MNVDSRNVSGTETPAFATIDSGAVMTFGGVQQGGIFIENTAGVSEEEVGISFREDVEIISAIDGFVPVAKAEGESSTVGTPGNAGIEVNEDGTYEMTYLVTIIINYLNENDEPIGDPDVWSERATAGSFIWKYNENFWLNELPKEGYEVLDWGGLISEDIEVIRYLPVMTMSPTYNVVLKATENAGTGQQTPPAGENGDGADKNQALLRQEIRSVWPSCWDSWEQREQEPELR